jgi:hypothetical protein
MNCNVHVFYKMNFSNKLGFILETSLFIYIYIFKISTAICHLFADGALIIQFGFQSPLMINVGKKNDKSSVVFSSNGSKAPTTLPTLHHQ